MALLEVRDLETQFATRAGIVRAVDRVSFSIAHGETLGLVGESGSGKTVMALSIMQLLDPPGRVLGGQAMLGGVDLLRQTEAQMLHIRGKRIAMIFQEPLTSLNPTVTVGEQLLEALKVETYDAWRRGPLAGMARFLRDRVMWDRREATEKRERAIALLESVRLPAARDCLQRYPYMLSGGMLQRIMVAIAMASQPELLIADEPTTAVDVTIQAQILQILRERKAAANLSILLITHDLGLIAEMCNRVAVMYAGRLVEQADVEDLFDAPRHPYTRGLLASMPSADRPIERLKAIEGSVPDLIGLRQEACHFAPRCPLATEVCRNERPAMLDVTAGHQVACHIYSHLDMHLLVDRLVEVWPVEHGPEVPPGVPKKVPA